MPKLAFSTTHNHNLVVNKAGELYVWGFNGSGRLGDGTNSKKNRPIRIDTSTNNTNLKNIALEALGIETDEGSTNNANLKNIAAGGYHSLAINKDDELYAWGLNNRGQLGDGSNTNKNIPIRIDIATNNANWKSIVAGYYHSLMINADGQLYAWGYNEYGQLGDGSNTNKNIPARIGTSTNWVKVVAGAYHNLAINKNGNSTPGGITNTGSWAMVAIPIKIYQQELALLQIGKT